MYSIQCRKYLINIFITICMKHVPGEISKIIQAKSSDVV